MIPSSSIYSSNALSQVDLHDRENQPDEEFDLLGYLVSHSSFHSSSSSQIYSLPIRLYILEII